MTKDWRALVGRLWLCPECGEVRSTAPEKRSLICGCKGMMQVRGTANLMLDGKVVAEVKDMSIDLARPTKCFDVGTITQTSTGLQFSIRAVEHWQDELLKRLGLHAAPADVAMTFNADVAEYEGSNVAALLAPTAAELAREFRSKLASTAHAEFKVESQPHGGIGMQAIQDAIARKKESQ